MSQSSLTSLRSSYPGRYGLTAEEAALVLRGSATRGTVQRVRLGMKEGRYPGARKVDGLWQIPLEALAEILDPTPAGMPVLPSISAVSPPASRRKSRIGPRILFIRQATIWSQVLKAMGAVYEDEILMEDIEAVLSDLRRETQQRRVDATVAELEKCPGANAPPRPGPRV